MGRRKISIKQIADPKLRHITFNKRRNGLIKKAAELSLLCNVNMLVIFEDGNGNLIQFSRNKITTIPSFFKECTYSSVSEFTAKDYPNFFKVNHYKKHKEEEGNEEPLEEMANEEEEDIPPAFEDPNQPAPQIKILNKRDTFSNAHHSTDEGYMSDHMVYYSGSEDSCHDGNEGVRTFSETPMREPYYPQPKSSHYGTAKPRAPRSEESQKPIIYEPEISRPYPEEQEMSPIHREHREPRETREPREPRETRDPYQNYKEMPPRGPIVDDKPMDYAQPYYERPMKRPSYSESGPHPYRYYPPEPPMHYAYPPHAYPYPYGYPYPPYGYPVKHRPRAYREVMPGEEAVNNMFKYPPRGFGMDPSEPYLNASKPSNKPEMDERITNTANMVKYLNNSGTNTYAGQKIYNFYSAENGKPEEEQPPVNYPKNNRTDFEGVPYDIEPEYQEVNPYHRGPDPRYENNNNAPNTIPTNLPAAYFSSRKFNFEGYPNSFEDDRFNEFSDPKKKLKQ